MAIYTNYGRYLKAKHFKEMLNNQGETYMLFGIGNPQWDASENPQEIPIAGYDTEILSAAENQFTDMDANLYFSNKENIYTALKNGTINTEQNITNLDQYMYNCRRLIPPFPVIYTNISDAIVISSDDGENVLQSTYQNYYIVRDDETAQYFLYKIGDDTRHVISIPTENSLARQYFSEMFIRGKVLTEHSDWKIPVGLLGAVKCNVEFVKDIGGEEDNKYTGGINQFWYGDRYWQTVNPDENDIIGDANGYIETDENPELNQDIYPHHLIFTATVNPRVLFGELKIDQYLVPRQIAIFTRPKKPKQIKNITETIEGETVEYKATPCYERENGTVEINYEEGKSYYRASEYLFNFGQYSESDITNMSLNDTSLKILNFTLRSNCNVKNNAAITNSIDYITPNGDFKFLLNDYIRGQVRENHSVDRFGYVVGF